MDTILHDRSDIDGTCVWQISVSTLINYPIWNGNRFVDEDRIELIRKGISTPNELHFVYHAIEYDGDEQFHHIEIVDGQHRIGVLKSIPLVVKDLHPVILIVKRVTTEEEAVAYFNKINDVKPQRCDDKKLLANSYVAALSKAFPKLVRLRTNRPYMDSAKLKEAILSYNVASVELTPERFVELAIQQNTLLLKKLREKLMTFPDHKKSVTIVKCIENKFALPFPDKFDWLKDIKLAM